MACSLTCGHKAGYKPVVTRRKSNTSRARALSGNRFSEGNLKKDPMSLRAKPPAMPVVVFLALVW
jgi:hypothetical protein